MLRSRLAIGLVLLGSCASGKVASVEPRSLSPQEREQSELEARVEGLRAALAHPESSSVEQIEALRREIVDEVEPASFLLDPALAAEVAELARSTERVLATRLHAEARAEAEAARDDFEARLAALAKYTRAEDEILELFERALWRDERELADFHQRHFREVIAESDALALAVFTPEYVARQPWKDLLGAEQASSWNVASLEGFWCRIEEGVLTLHGPNAGTRQCGVVSICDREQLRDFVLELEFTLTKGEFELYLRVGKRFDGTVESLKFSTLEDSPDFSFLLSQGESYGGVVTFIGSSWTCALSAGDPQTMEQVKWGQSRKGAIGLVVQPGTELAVTRLRVRSLRQSGSN